MQPQLNWLKNSGNYLFLTVVAVLCTMGIVWLQSPLLKETADIAPEEYWERQTLKQVQLELLQKIPAFGFSNLVADWAFLDFVQYYGDGKGREVTGYQLVPDYFQIVVNRDPRFITAYLFLDPATTLFAGRPRKSVELMNQGLKYLQPTMPLAYQVWMYKGIDELLFLGETQEARESYQVAAEWAKLENTPIGVAHSERAQETAQFLAQNPDSKLARASAWMMILANARDEQTRKIALENLKKLGAEVIITPYSISVKMPQNEE
jgi:hypothetical protein